MHTLTYKKILDQKTGPVFFRKGLLTEAGPP